MNKNQPVCEILSEADLKQICVELPKCELHAHISGSFPPSSIRAILAELPNGDEFKDVPLVVPLKSVEKKGNWERTMKRFAAINAATSDMKNFSSLFIDALQALSKDGVLYAELRVSLKPTPTKRDYLNTLLVCMESVRESTPNATTVRLLISLARHGEPSYNEDTLDVVISYMEECKAQNRTCFVCGIDLGGTPSKGNWTDFAPLLQRARDVGLPLTLHCGERTANHEEHHAMIDFTPGRLGHCLCFFKDECKDCLAHLLRGNIPVEVCLTAHWRGYAVPVAENALHSIVPSFADTPHHPIVLCTDNPTLLDTCLSQEYWLACVEYHLTVNQLFRLARTAIDYAFVSDTTKQELRDSFDEKVDALMTRYFANPS